MPPAPKPPSQRRRRNASPSFRQLPARYAGKVPPWPIGKPSKEQTELWRWLWTRPQAHMWDLLGMERNVAEYVVLQLAADKPEASRSALSEARLTRYDLGLSPRALRALGWEVLPPEDSGPGDGSATVTSIDRYRAMVSE